MNITTSTVFVTSTTSELSTAGSPFTFIHLPLWVRILQAIAYIVELIFGVTLNTFFFCLILFSKSLRQRGFAVTIQIFATNLVFSVLILSSCAHVARFDEWTLGNDFCQLIAFCHQWLQPQRWLLTAVLVIDRTLTISRPLRYEKHGNKVVAILSLSATILALVIGLLPHMIPLLRLCNGFTPGTNTCHTLILMSNCGIYTVSYSAFVFMVGGVIPFSLYTWMFYKARKANRQVLPTPQSLTANGMVSPHLSVTRKQILTVFLLFWTLLGCTVPFYSTFLFLYFSFLANWPDGYFIGYGMHLFFQPLFYGLVIADPITLMWHKDVKQELTKISLKCQNLLQGILHKVINS